MTVTAFFFVGRFYAAAEESFINPNPANNRWGIILDAVSSAEDSTPERSEAFERFRNELIDAGFLPDHLLFFTSADADPTRHPTKENILKLLDGIRNPDLNRLPGSADGEAARRIRMDDGDCELQFYVIAGGVADAQRTKNLIVPAGVATDQIKSSDDASLIPLSEIEDALIHPGEGQKALDRTFLAVNFISLFTVTRGGAPDSPLQEIDLTRVPFRGGESAEGQEDQFQAEGQEDRFQHIRVLTKNEDMADETADSFYQMLQNGLRGFADISGNQDGIVQAGELAQYLESNGRPGSVEIAQNGNDPYPICRSRQEPTIPAGLFAEIGRTFTLDMFKAERASAFERSQKNKSNSTGTMR